MLFLWIFWQSLKNNYLQSSDGYMTLGMAAFIELIVELIIFAVWLNK